MKRCVVILSLLAVVLCGCSSTLYVQARPGVGQDLRYEAGYPILSSDKVNAVVMRPVFSPIENKLMFYIAVANLTDAPFLLSQELVSASCGEDQLRLWSRAEIMSKIEREAAWNAFFVALGAAAQTYNASQPSTTTGSEYFSGYGSGGSVYGTFSGSFTTYDPAASEAAKAMIRMNATQQLESIASSASARQASVQSILTMETVDPGAYRGGFLLVDVPRRTGGEPKPVTFRVHTPRDVHVFRFSVSRGPRKPHPGNLRKLGKPGKMMTKQPKMSDAIGG